MKLGRADALSRYEVLEPIGHGGSARVFRARDLAGDREVALKLVNEAESAWLLREFKTLRSIQHENLIRVFDSSVLASGEAFYTMELVEGGDLGAQISGPKAEEWLRPLLIGTLRGLGHLHCHGEVHGDLKPSNILLGPGGVVKVSDVGMGNGTSSRSLMSGTPGYTAPEAWSDMPLNIRSDLYSVGVIAYEALSGRHPFGARTIREVIAGQVAGWVPSLGSQGVTLSPGMERAIMRALERDPELRYGSADEFLDAVGAGGVGEIVGGRFVGRGREKDKVRAFALSNANRAPSLLYIAGPEGVGKSALWAEVNASDDCMKETVFAIREPEHDLARLAALQDDTSRSTQGMEVEGISGLAGALLVRFADASFLGVEDPPSSGDLVRRLARYLWAEAEERGVSTRIRFVKLVKERPSSLEAFESCVDLIPFEAGEAEELTRGILGPVNASPQFWRRLVEEVGGFPRMLATAVLELVHRKLVSRKFGQWEVSDLSDEHWSSLRACSSQWESAWGRLSSEAQDILVAISLVQSGLSGGELALLFDGIDLTGSISRLRASGWVETYSSKILPSSRDVGRVVLAAASDAKKDTVRQRVLGILWEELPRGDRASLMLSGEPSGAAVSEGLWLGLECNKGQRYEQALEILTQTRNLARRLGDASSLRRAGLLAAETLHRIGNVSASLSVLEEDTDWGMEASDPGSWATRAMLRGRSFKVMRDLDSARREFQSCVDYSRLAGDRRLELQAESELAELEWRHGGEEGRCAAAKRIRALLSDEDPSKELRDEWAALRYQLGASLVLSGERDEAIHVLEGALKLSASNYWQMRICNALNAAHYYLGHLRTALELSDRAWQHAIDGRIDSFKPRLLASAAGIRFGLGMFREAAEQGEMSAFWGRRIGSPFEYEAGLLAAASDLIQIAEFERALVMTTEARRSASKEPASRHIAKSLELEALALLHIGDYGGARDRIAEAHTNLVGRGFDDMIPRLRWHAGRIKMEEGYFDAAEAEFVEALKELERTRDWEDLPGVQVEMQLLLARAGDQRLDTEELSRLLEDARGKGLCPVQLRVTLALAEISVLGSKLTGEVPGMLEEGLRLAERCGAREFVWRLSYWCSRVLMIAGDRRGAVARMGTAVRVLREVASELAPEHRSLYLGTSHARLLLSEARSN